MEDIAANSVWFKSLVYYTHVYFDSNFPFVILEDVDKFTSWCMISSCYLSLYRSHVSLNFFYIFHKWGFFQVFIGVNIPSSRMIFARPMPTKCYTKLCEKEIPYHVKKSVWNVPSVLIHISRIHLFVHHSPCL